MSRPFCEHHLIQFFDEFEAGTIFFDLSLYNYFKAHKALGSKDRKVITEWAIALMRWQTLLDYKIKGTPSWEKRFDVWQKIDLEEALSDKTIPEDVKACMPKYLFGRLKEIFGDNALSLALLCNERAPITIRANLVKTDRDALLEILKKDHEVVPTKCSHTGITFLKPTLFKDIEVFKKGFFEVQDEGSQLLSDLVDVLPGELFLDYCAGSGGKTLAIAPKMQGKGQIFYHDIRPKALLEAKERLRRAGVQNGQRLDEDSPQWKRLRKKVDWVLVDAPCSGTGTLRRNPDLKWKIDKEAINELVGKQRHIFERALQFVKPKGHIVYATCSLLPEENSQQVDHFLKTYPIELVNVPFQTIPTSQGMDGFFAAVFIVK